MDEKPGMFETWGKLLAAGLASVILTLLIVLIALLGVKLLIWVATA